MKISITRQPSFAKAMAQAFPMPDEAPVTITTLFFRESGTVEFFRDGLEWSQS